MKKLSFSVLMLLCLFNFTQYAWSEQQAAPFELYPPQNTAAPAVYTKAAPVFRSDGKPWDFTGGPEVKIKIDAAKVVCRITPYQFGNNAAWYDGKNWFLDPDRIEKARQAGIRFWRWPGGSSSDNYFWEGDYSKHLTDSKGKEVGHMNKPWAVGTDDFIDFCKKTGSEAIFTVNYAAARYINVQEAASMAARWVKYCNIEKKFKVRYWEIGNEVYGPWEEGNQIEGKPQLTGDIYAKDFRIIADAMRKVDPDIYIGAVAVDTDDGSDWTGYRWWMRDMLPSLSGAADFLIQHYYYGGWPYDKNHKYMPPSNEKFFSDLSSGSEGKGNIDGMLKKYAAGQQGPLPVAFTEFNMKENPVQSIELINGLFISEVLGENIKAGFAAANLWDWKNGLDKKTNGDHGMLSSNDPSTPDATPRASYYSYALYYRAFGDKMIEAESPDPEVKVYASSFSGGELGMVIVNESSRSRTVVFDLAGFIPKGKLMGWVLTGKSLNEKQVSWNGVEGPPGGGPFPIDPIPPYQATFTSGAALRLSVQACSATGIVVY